MAFSVGFMSYITLLLGSIILIVTTGCSAGSFQFQNDVFGGTDENFTNGFSLSHSAKPENLPNSIKSVVDNIPVFSDSPLKTVLSTVRQDMYTPDDLKSEEVVENENPYAGSLTLGVRKVVANETERASTEIRFGSSGPPSLAGQTQIFVHDTLTDLGRKQTHPSGWDNQIEAEPLLNIEHNRDWEAERINVGKLNLVPINRLAFSAGNINTGAQYNHGYMFGYNVPELDRENVFDKMGIYLFGEAFGIATLHNLYYDGGVLRDSKHTVDSSPLVGGLDSGVGIEYKNYSVKFHYITRTKTFKEQQDNFHSFGFLSFGVEW